MGETWSCQNCGEKVSDSYVECWSCQSPRPGYSTAAEQVKRCDEQHAEWLRQNEVATELQTAYITQSQVAKELLELEVNNQARFSKLLDRWEKLTDRFERRDDRNVG